MASDVKTKKHGNKSTTGSEIHAQLARYPSNAKLTDPASKGVEMIEFHRPIKTCSRKSPAKITLHSNDGKLELTILLTEHGKTVRATLQRKDLMTVLIHREYLSQDRLANIILSELTTEDIFAEVLKRADITLGHTAKFAGEIVLTNLYINPQGWEHNISSRSINAPLDTMASYTRKEAESLLDYFEDDK